MNLNDYSVDFTIDGIEYNCEATLYDHGVYVDSSDYDKQLPAQVTIIRDPVFQNLVFYCYETEEYLSGTTAMIARAEEIMCNVYWALVID